MIKQTNLTHIHGCVRSNLTLSTTDKTQPINRKASQNSVNHPFSSGHRRWFGVMPGASVVTILSTFPFYLRQMSNGNLSGSGDESCGTGMLGVEGVMAIVNR